MDRATLDASAWIGREVEVVVDRPAGSTHPDGEPMYPINYGFLPGTEAGDGEAIDAYVLDPAGPVSRAVGRVIAVVHRRDDVEDKLVVAADGVVRSPEQITAAVAFQERFFDSTVVVGRAPHT